MRVEGYDYAAFCRAVGALRGRGCWVEALLKARCRVETAEWLASCRPGELGPTRAVAAWRRFRDCDGEPDAHHVIPKQRIKSEFALLNPCDDWPVQVNRLWAEGGSEFVTWESLAAMLMDPRNGAVVCRRHHDLLERRLVVPMRDELPAGVEDFAAELGMAWSLGRDFGEKQVRGVA